MSHRPSPNLPIGPFRQWLEQQIIQEKRVPTGGAAGRSNWNPRYAVALRLRRSTAVIDRWLETADTIPLDQLDRVLGAAGVNYRHLYPDAGELRMGAQHVRGDLCDCGERMLEPAPRCGFCEHELAELGQTFPPPPTEFRNRAGGVKQRTMIVCPDTGEVIPYGR